MHCSWRVIDKGAGWPALLSTALLSTAAHSRPRPSSPPPPSLRPSQEIAIANAAGGQACCRPVGRKLSCVALDFVSDLSRWRWRAVVVPDGCATSAAACRGHVRQPVVGPGAVQCALHGFLRCPAFPGMHNSDRQQRLDVFCWAVGPRSAARGLAI